MTATAHGWKELGIDATPVILPTQRWNDREYVAKFPAFRMNRQANEMANLRNFQSVQSPLPENNFVGVNYSRYVSEELDSLIARYFVTIPREERTRALGEILRHMTDVVNVMGVFHDVQPTMVAHRITGFSCPGTGWNAHTWDVK
jgi:hypothetical protein